MSRGHQGSTCFFYFPFSRRPFRRVKLARTSTSAPRLLLTGNVPLPARVRCACVDALRLRGCIVMNAARSLRQPAAHVFDKRCTWSAIVHAAEIGHSLMHVSVQLVQMPSVSISAQPLPPSLHHPPPSCFSKQSSQNSLSHCWHNFKTKSTTKLLI